MSYTILCVFSFVRGWGPSRASEHFFSVPFVTDIVLGTQVIGGTRVLLDDTSLKGGDETVNVYKQSKDRDKLTF